MAITITRRSFVRRQLEHSGARFVQTGDSSIAANFGDATAEAEQARTIALADLSALPRSGFKGPGTVAWLSAQGIQAGADPNRAFPQADESLVAMLSWSEALILDDPLQGSGPSEKLIGAWTLDSAAGCYALPRRDSHYWFALCGVRAAEAFSKLCPVDLRPEAFSNSRVAQTSAARSNVNGGAAGLRGRCGTLIAATAVKRSGRISAALQATFAPQSCPTMQACVSPSAATSATMSPTRSVIA